MPLQNLGLSRSNNVKPLPEDINRILLESNTAAQSLRQLYELHKSHHRKVSLSFLCKRAGIPSKGYLAFVMAGKRRLHSKYWSGICAVFKLNYRQSEILRLLFEIDADSDPQKQEACFAKIQNHRERLSQHDQPLSHP